MSSFLDYVNEQKKFREDRKLLLEGFGDKTLAKALEAVTNILRKNISGKKVFMYQKPNSQGYLTKVNDQNCVTYFWGVLGKGSNVENVVGINFVKSGSSNEVYSFSIFDSDKVIWNGKDKAKTTVYTMGASIAYFLPLIYHIINSHDYKVGAKEVQKFAANVEQNLSKVDKKRQGVKESYHPFYVGALKYNVFSGTPEEDIYKEFIGEGSLEDAKKKIHQKMKDLEPEKDSMGKSYRQLVLDYYAIVKAIKGGTTEIEDLDIEIKSDIVTEILQGEGDEEVTKKFNKEAEKLRSPDEQWKEMQLYINMVIKGTQPSVILCGAPGVGKTYRVKKQLKARGFKENHNMFTIKGKCTPRQLYIALYNYQRKGDIVLIDDADSVVGPKAPEDVINILKAALDSTADDEGRLVSYQISGKLEDDDGTPIPKRFYYNGGVIVITNYTAGQLDTALRGRSYVQDIFFTVEQILEIVKGLLPELGQREGISKEAKMKAFEYMQELAKNKEKIEISIRTFGICAKIFDAADGDSEVSEDDVRGMIKRQLQLQALRGGKKH